MSADTVPNFSERNIFRDKEWGSCMGRKGQNNTDVYFRVNVMVETPVGKKSVTGYMESKIESPGIATLVIPIAYDSNLQVSQEDREFDMYVGVCAANNQHSLGLNTHNISKEAFNKLGFDPNESIGFFGSGYSMDTSSKDLASGKLDSVNVTAVSVTCGEINFFDSIIPNAYAGQSFIYHPTMRCQIMADRLVEDKKMKVSPNIQGSL